MPVGGQPGNQNAAKAKRWESALERAFSAYPNPPDCTDCNDFMRGLNLAAHEFVKNVMTANDIQFFRETGDRFDGKAVQSVQNEHSGHVTLTANPTDESL